MRGTRDRCSVLFPASCCKIRETHSTVLLSPRDLLGITGLKSSRPPTFSKRKSLPRLRDTTVKATSQTLELKQTAKKIFDFFLEPKSPLSYPPPLERLLRVNLRIRQAFSPIGGRPWSTAKKSACVDLARRTIRPTETGYLARPASRSK